VSAPTRRANWNLPKSLLTRARKGRNALVTRLQSECPRRFALRSIATCARSKDGKEKSDFRTAKRGGKKGNPVNHNFAQLTKKIKKLKKALKKSGKKGKKHHYEDSDSNSE
jgi:hypothetical protein